MKLDTNHDEFPYNPDVLEGPSSAEADEAMAAYVAVKVEAGLEDVRCGRVRSNAEVEADFAARRAALALKMEGKLASRPSPSMVSVPDEPKQNQPG